MVDFDNSGIRIADDDIYLNEDRRDQPKEMFKFIRSVLSMERVNTGIRWLDVGCATGDFIHYVSELFPKDFFTGVDVSPKLIEKAKGDNPQHQFSCRDLLQGNIEKMSQYDIVISTGVLQILDEVVQPIKNLISLVAPGGKLVITGSFNAHDIDVLMRYRRVPESNTWETGWNLFSTSTYERCLRAESRVKQWEWHDFRMPFKLEQKKDVMRSWTISTEINDHQLVNGASQLLFVKSCVVQIGE